MIRTVLLAVGMLLATPAAAQWQAVTSSDGSLPVARHEAGFVEVGDKFYLIGGRRIQPVSIFDPKTMRWTQGAAPPVEMHHVQPVAHDGKIWFVGAFTGKYPAEQPLPNIHIYDPATDSWSEGPAMPEGRARGGAGAIIVGGSLYLMGGATIGHLSGQELWVDRYDFASGKWSVLADMPRYRDHFQAASDGKSIYVAGGRISQAKPDTFRLTIGAVDRYDLAANSWSSLENFVITPRAGSMSAWIGNKLWLVGGESMTIPTAHPQVEVLTSDAEPWTSESEMLQGRHGSGLIEWGGYVWVASGSGGRGGAPELTTMERLPLK